MTPKIKVKEVEVLSAEGLHRIADFFPQTYTREDSFSEASASLDPTWRNAPTDGTYHKVHFRVQWADGHAYAGRIDVMRDGEKPDIARHMRAFTDFRCGDACPGHLDPAKYAALIERYGDASAWRDLRDNYDLGAS